MLIYTLNALNDILVKQLKAIPKELYATKDKPDKPVEESWVHSLFQGQLTSETTCLTCETVFPLFVDVKNFLLTCI